jgi:hypothetical protein
MAKENKFTAAEEKRIQEEVKAYKIKAREAEIQAEIRNRILDEQRQTPGSKY